MPSAPTTSPTLTPPLASSRVIDSLISADLLDPADRDRAVAVISALTAPHGAPPQPPNPPRRDLHGGRSGAFGSLVEVVGYLGGALVLAAGALFVATSWSELSFSSQVTGLAVAAVCLALAGVLVSRRDAGSAPAATRRLASTLLTGSALVAGGLVGLVVDHQGGTPSNGSLNWTEVAVCAVILGVVLVGRRLADSAFATLVLFSSLCALVSALVTPYDGRADLGVTAALLLVALAWSALAERDGVTDPTLRRVLGAGLALYAAQTPLFASFNGNDHSALAYGLTSLVIAAGVAAYLRLQAWPYLAAAVIGVTVVVPEAVTDWTHGDLGATGAVLLTGVTLLVASLLGARLLHAKTD